MKSIVAAVLVVSFVAVMSSSAQRRKHIQTVAPKSRVDYSRFSHRTHVTQQKLACDSCHKLPTDNWKKVRKGDEAFPDVADFPEHTACLNCHRPQFFLRERPAPAICSNCHIAVTPRDSTRWLFPSLGDTNSSTNHVRKVTSEFGVAFPHDKHLDTVGLLRHGSLSPPIFVNALFQQKSEVLPKSCPVCHQLYEPQGTSSDEYVTKPPQNLGDNF